MDKGQSRFLVFLGNLIVDTKVCLGANAESLVLFSVYADIDRKEADIVSGKVFIVLCDSRPCPVSVLHKSNFFQREFRHGVFNSHAGKHCRLSAGIIDVQIKDLFEIVHIGSVQSIGIIYAFVLVLIVQRHVEQVVCPSPFLSR